MNNVEPMTTSAGALSDLEALTPEDRDLDVQASVPEDVAEIDKLRDFLTERFEARDKDGGEVYEGWSEYFEGALAGLPILEEQERTFPLDEGIVDLGIVTSEDVEDGDEEDAGKTGKDAGTYKLDVKVANGLNGEQIKKFVNLMLKAAQTDTTKKFYDRAKKVGLSYRREDLPFPHKLPYKKPPPATKEGQYQEEALVVAAAVHFACTQPTPTKITIKPLTGRPRTVTGRAWKNFYNRNRTLEIELNPVAIDELGMSDAEWAGVVAHEILHNLGWTHPKGRYPKSLAIEIYEDVISGEEATFLDRAQLIR